MLADVLLVLACLYALMMLLFALAVARARFPFDRTYQPAVSIVIAARNEEENIRICLESIAALSYPTNLLDVVVVNDRSTDGTAGIVQEFSDKYAHMKLLLATPESGHLRGKTNAVTQGIEASAGEIILFTDADCRVPRGWVEETVKYYTDDQIGIVAGFTALKTDTWFQAIQSIDWFMLFSVAAAALRMNYPVTAVGNNLSVRRKAYQAVGGYREIPFSVTEDYALFHAVTSTGKYQARFPLDATSLVASHACRTWSDLYRQKKRWFRGGEDMELRHQLILTVAYAFKLLLIVGICAGNFPSILIPLGIKSVVDFMVALPTALSFHRLKQLLYFPLFEIYFILYVLIFPIIVLTGQDVVWKDRTFESKSSNR